ncbi:MAG TPA: hypothetical protein VJX29_13195 [Candidatus Acidoferrales bacterium]|nr:hypothetical protein [Candidatus Acidoferrales bacterium]
MIHLDHTSVLFVLNLRERGRFRYGVRLAIAAAREKESQGKN